MSPRIDGRSIEELRPELSRETAQLVRQELELATAEITVKAKQAGGHAATAAVGGALAHAGLLVFLAALVLGLSQLGITPWLSALTISLVTLGIGYSLIHRGLAGLHSSSIGPTRALDSTEESSRWRTRTREGV